MNPNFQNIGTAFTTAYYQAFDSCANGDERGVKISQFYHVSTIFFKIGVTVCITEIIYDM